MSCQRSVKKWDDLQAGTDIGSIQYRIATEDVARYAGAIDNLEPWYVDDSPFGGPLVPPFYFCDDYLQLLMREIDYPLDVLHARLEHDSKCCIYHGTLVTVSGRIADRYIRRGRDHIVVETTATDELGNTLSVERNILSRQVRKGNSIGS